MPTIFGSADADLSVLAGQRVAVVGYGNLGRSMALNLRDAGVDVVVGNIEDDCAKRAAQEGFSVLAIQEALSVADLSYLLLPDEVLVEHFDSLVRPHLRPGSALAFASGYFLAFGLGSPLEGIDLVMLAPRMLGEQVREATLSGAGYLSYCCVHADDSGQALARLLALAEGAGSLRRGAMWLPAEQEALVDLFVEQTVGPYIGLALQAAFSVGTEVGIPPEAMVLELYASGEMSKTFAAFASEGFLRSVEGHGAVAAYGGFLRTLQIDVSALREQFCAVAEEIRSGAFAAKLAGEARSGYPTLNLIRSFSRGDDPISRAEQRLREALGDLH